jgi:hypothetical protein
VGGRIAALSIGAVVADGTTHAALLIASLPRLPILKCERRNKVGRARKIGCMVELPLSPFEGQHTCCIHVIDTGVCLFPSMATYITLLPQKSSVLCTNHGFKFQFGKFSVPTTEIH